MSVRGESKTMRVRVVGAVWMGSAMMLSAVAQSPAVTTPSKSSAADADGYTGTVAAGEYFRRRDAGAWNDHRSGRGADSGSDGNAYPPAKGRPATTAEDR